MALHLPEDQRPTKLQMRADAWGLRKLISYALRTMRAERIPRVTRLGTDPEMFSCMVHACVHGHPAVDSGFRCKGVTVDFVASMVSRHCSRGRGNSCVEMT